MYGEPPGGGGGSHFAVRGVVGWRLGTWGGHTLAVMLRGGASNRRPKQKIGGGRLAVRKGQLSKTKRERR